MPSTHRQPTDKRPRRGGALGRPVHALVGLAVAAIMVDTYVVGGLFVPAVVSGGSMAPTLLGAHRTWRCNRCEQPFACNLESLPAAGRAALCPHCGTANDPAQGRDVPGQRVWVDRTAFAWRSPQRWETIVFRLPEQPNVLAVKRVVGLPGEVVDLAAGDVVIDGRVADKNPRIERAMAIELAAAADARHRWHADESSPWKWRQTRFVHDARSSDNIDWLEYRHIEPLVPASPAGAILDGSPYDQSESRPLNPVADFSLCFDLETSTDGAVHLRAQSRGDLFEVTLDAAAGQSTLAHNGRLAAPCAMDGYRASGRCAGRIGPGRSSCAAGRRWSAELAVRLPAARRGSCGGGALGDRGPCGARRGRQSAGFPRRVLHHGPDGRRPISARPGGILCIGRQQRSLGGQPQLDVSGLGRFAVGARAGMVG